MTPFLHIDRTVFHWINTDWSNPILDVSMPWVTHLGDAPAVCVCIALAGLLFFRQLSRLRSTGQGGGQRIMKAVTFYLLYLALISGLNSGAYHSLKYIVHRPRPFLQETVLLRVSPATASNLHDGSFPSGHAANAFMVAVFFAELLRRKRYALYGLAALVAFSRIYLGVHYPVDVLAGGILGFSIARMMLSFYPRTSVGS